jgi:hypothetical protein
LVPFIAGGFDDFTMDKGGYNGYQIANVAAIALALVVNFLANWLPINGVNTGQVADSYPNLFTPPGYIFAIWGIIYALAIAFAAYQVRASQRNAPYLPKIGWLYLTSAVINTAWILVFHYSYGNPSLYLLSTLLLLLLLGNLLLIYHRLYIGGEAVTRNVKLCIHIPISIYVGWISVASIAGLASAFNILLPGMPTATQAILTAAMLVVALTLTCFMLWLYRDLIFALVMVWAVSGIAAKQADIPVINLTALAVIVVAALALLAIPIVKKIDLVEYYLS